MKRSIPGIIIMRLIGFLIFLIILAIANSLISNVNYQIYTDIINFFKENILLLAGMALLGIISEIFWCFYFPFNLIAPFASAILSIPIIAFIYHIWLFLNKYLNVDLPFKISLVYIITFLIVLLVGYIKILAQGKQKRDSEDEDESDEEIEDRDEDESENKNVKKKVEIKKRTSNNIYWSDVGYQFREFFYNIGRSLNSLFNNKKK